jgi:radical SAM protein with 4Fe4S-binding SPASM domain
MTPEYAEYRRKYLNGPDLNLTSPVDVSLELACACDMACKYCYWSDPKNVPFTKGLMKREMALDFVKQAAEIGAHSIKLNYRGEGTLNPAYREVAELAKSLAHGSTLIDRLANSNFKFHPKRREDIFEGLSCLTKVKVSYDSFNKEVFETQRAGGNHDLTTENIDLFYNHPSRIKSGTALVIQAVRTKLNKDEDIAGLAKKRWPEASVSIRDMVAGRVDKDVTQFENKERDRSERQTCIQAHVRLMIHWDGRVGPCCPAIANNLFIGDANKQTLLEVFNSIEAKKLRQDLRSGEAFKLDPCRTCSSFESYKGFVPAQDS